MQERFHYGTQTQTDAAKSSPIRSKIEIRKANGSSSGRRQLEKWNELRQILEPVGLLTEADKDQLAQYCINWELYLVCVDQIRKGGMVNTYEGKAGMDYKQSDPYVVNMYKLHAAMMKTATQFGLTPSARASIDVGKTADADPLKEFMG